MNKPISPKDVTPLEVTTGPLSGSRKIYSSPEGDPDLRVPFREIALGGGEPSASSSEAVGQKNCFRVYDTSGPYTDEADAIDVKRGLPHLRAPWIEARAHISSPPPLRGRSDREAIGEGGEKQSPALVHTPLPDPPPQGGREWRRGAGLAHHPVTQIEFARAGIITKEMVYIAHRENIGRQRQDAEAEASEARRWRELRCERCRPS